MSASVLKIFDPERPIRMKTNASDLVIKTCLSQKYNEWWHFVVYFWRKLSSAE